MCSGNGGQAGQQASRPSSSWANHAAQQGILLLDDGSAELAGLASSAARCGVTGSWRAVTRRPTCRRANGS